jgi:long-chain acyl-CoA synthetase
MVDRSRHQAPRTIPQTFPALVDQVCRSFGERVFLARRDSQGGGSVTYRELVGEVRRLAAGLLALGLRPGDRIAILAGNGYRWILADLATTYAGMVDVPRGADTAPAELLGILGHAGCRLALAEDDCCARELVRLQPQLPELSFVGSLRNTTELDGVLTLPEIMARGEPHLAELAEISANVRPADLMTLVYTSGTTAEPKGVMLSHHNITSNMCAVAQVLHVAPGDVFLSILPAWHTYERMMDYLAMASGSQLVYTNRRQLRDDLRQVRPTIFAAVPRVWESLHDGIVNHCQKMPGRRRKFLLSVLKNARDVGGRRASRLQRFLHRLYRPTVLRAFRRASGGRLRICVSGGGALPPHVDECLLGIGLPLLNGYGLTETSPVVAVRPPWNRRPRTIGPPLPDTEIEIRGENGAVRPPGETGVLWIKGPQVMQGYYRNPERTAQVLADGWFNSGDLGHKDERGYLYITGRAKDTIVLASGENVEPEPLETAIKTSSLVDQAVVVGQDRKCLGAILVPMAEVLEEQVPRPEWGECDGFLRGQRVRQLFRRELDQLLSRQRGFRPCENVAHFHLRLEPMTQENELLTPTLKVRRHIVQARFEREITEMFDA